MTTADILRAARKLVEHPDGWTRKRYDNSDSFGEGATCFCMAGAVWHAVGLDPMEEDGRRNIPLEYLQLAVGAKTEGQLILWNDELNRTHAEVLSAFDRAIELAELSLRNIDEHLIGGGA